MPRPPSPSVPRIVAHPGVVRPPDPLARDLLAGREVRLAGSGVGVDYTELLLDSLGACVLRAPGRRESHPALEWARSGAMRLTGSAAGPPILAPGPLATCARATLEAIRLLAGERGASGLSGVDGASLLGERAAVLGLSRRGTTSPGGTCRLLRARDGWLALNLARPDDRSLLPAWLGVGDGADPWSMAAPHVRRRPAAELVERARLLGLPAALAVEPDASPPTWVRVAARGPSAGASRSGRPLVVDLSCLWAGPLCTHLLERTGARVVKVESIRRPDGARFGPPAFFDLLNAGKESVCLDFGTATGRRQLHRLVERADIVVESSRPRALRQLGIDAESRVRARPGLTWVSITGYGRAEPEAGWVAFGDDASVAAGLALATGSAEGPPLFCGDAIADPLTGIHAALAALASWKAGGGHLLDLALRNVVAHALGFRPESSSGAAVHRIGGEWFAAGGDELAAVAPPRARPAPAPARPMGADTEAVLRDLAVRC